MKVRSCLTLVLAVALVVGVMAPSAGAWCTIHGHAIGLSNYYNTTTWDLWTIVYVKYINTNYFDSTPSYLYYFVTKEPGLINLCNMAVMNGRPIMVSGNAASCPGSGTFRNGGEIEQMKAW